MERPRVRFTAGKQRRRSWRSNCSAASTFTSSFRLLTCLTRNACRGYALSWHSPGVSFRLAHGGLGIANLTNAVQFTGYPGPAQVPADAWSANEADA